MENSIDALLENSDPALVRGALLKSRKEPKDLALLLSKGADGMLEEIARRARQVKLARFGRVVNLYAPLYVSNHCIGQCPYCGFRNDRETSRKTLSLAEIKQEGEALKKMGIRHVLLVSGEFPLYVDTNYLAKAIALLKESFPAVSVEVAPLAEEEYQVLRDAGADGVTLYQETYNPFRYREFHSTGHKADFGYRLEALDRAGAAGMRNLTAGALFGLSPWRQEALRLGLHARHLQKKWWKSQIAVGLPRLRDVPSDFDIPYPLDDRSFVHIMVALKVFLEDLGIAISTRESPQLRESLVHLGVTQMSAGSKTEPGGYCLPGAATDQFEVSDERSPAEVAQSLLSLGYDPVWKDWDRGLGRGR